MVAFFFPPPVKWGVTRSITQTDSRTGPNSASSGANTFNTVACGSAQGSSRILIFAWHGDIGINPGTTPTCTVGGSGATRKDAQSTGGGGDAVGTAIFEIDGTSLGGSQTVVVTWGSFTSTLAIVVLRVVGYSFVSPSANGEAASGSDGQLTFNLANNSAVLAIAGSGGNASDLVWSNLTERGQDTNYGAGADNVRSWGWTADIPTNASYTISVTPWSTANGANSMSAIALAPL